MIPREGGYRFSGCDRALYYLSQGAGSASVGQVDAELVDVYRGAHALVISTAYLMTVTMTCCLAGSLFEPNRTVMLPWLCSLILWCDSGSYEYIKALLSDPKLPPELPVAILVNFRDLVTDENRQVSSEEYTALTMVCTYCLVLAYILLSGRPPSQVIP